MFYHYTSLSAFQRIIQTKKVWMSSLAFMNDAKEGLDLINILIDSPSFASYTSEEPEKRAGLLEALKTTVETMLRWQHCFSTSTLNDNISQWRAYTQLGHGVCLGFSDDFIQDKRVKRVECIYDIEKKRQVVAESATPSEDDLGATQMLGALVGSTEFVFGVVKTLSRFKDPSFSPEREVRWVLSYSGLSEAMGTISYRADRLGLVPYSEVDIDITKLSSVILGPQVPEPNFLSTEDLLLQYGCNNARLRKSQTSLR